MKDPNEYLNPKLMPDFDKIENDLFNYPVKSVGSWGRKWIRKIAWQIVKQFHFYQIQEFYNLYQRQVSAFHQTEFIALANRIEYLEAQLKLYEKEHVSGLSQEKK